MSKSARPAAVVPAKSVRPALLPNLRQLILTAREQVARTVDSTLVALNWEIGRRISQDILSEKRATYGRPDCLDGVETVGTGIRSRVR